MSSQGHPLNANRHRMHLVNSMGKQKHTNVDSGVVQLVSHKTDSFLNYIIIFHTMLKRCDV
jgi:hypothetical protein